MQKIKSQKHIVPTETHKELLGRVLKEGQYVAVSDGSLHIAKVLRFTPKMVEIEVIDRKYRSKRLKYADEMVLLEGEEIFMWVLTNGG
jgi:hypothetical protein